MTTNSDILRFMKVPPVYDTTFDTFDPTIAGWKPETIQHVKELAQQRRWIIICGTKTDIGKTRLAVCAMLESCLNDTYNPRSFALWSYYRFISIRRIINISDIRAKADMFEEATTKRCILLDEMGREKDKWIADQIDALIFGFEEDHKQVIGTSGMNAKDFIEFYDESIIRRIEQQGEIVER